MEGFLRELGSGTHSERTEIVVVSYSSFLETFFGSEYSLTAGQRFGLAASVSNDLI
jgi:hypothetical protein